MQLAGILIGDEYKFPTGLAVPNATAYTWYVTAVLPVDICNLSVYTVALLSVEYTLAILLFSFYHARHDQYRAFVLGPGFSQLCLALKLRLRAGLDFFIVMSGSPKLTLTTLPVLGFLT